MLADKPRLLTDPRRPFMTNSTEAALQYLHTHRSRILEDLQDFIRIPSISTNPAAKADMQRAAEWLANQLHHMGISNVQIFPTTGHPVVYGESLDAGIEKPTMLVYGHYDVQPAEPFELWQSPAFEPTQRGDNLYGRGASDMKGQVVATLKAIEALTLTGKLPINIKFMIEGEEEIGSPSLGAFIQEHKALLACDFALNPDTGMIGAEIPTITYGLRGLAYFELRLTGPNHDLHSGIYGGAVHNPAQVLCEVVAGMHDSQGRITLPGFYDKVRSLDASERAALEKLPMGEAFYLEQTGAPALYGEADYSSSERVGARPTLEVNGLLAGFTGEGSKTVLPAKAMVKISMRLVPDQDPEEVHQQLLSYLKQHVPPTVRWELIKMAGGRASITDINFPAIIAISQALEATWGKPPVFRREGGSVPVVDQMQKILGIESVMTGFGLPDDNLHAPNEKIHLPTFYRGIEALVRFIAILGA
jgi:acetylornithine deacetylase/succinyl-diaminopimelate desuccinylase-like protein